MKLSH